MSDALSVEEIAEIERACTRLVLDAAAANDRNDFQAFADCFARGGILSRPSGEPLEGPEAIAASYSTRPASRITRHLVSNIRIDVESSTVACGLSYVVLYAGDSGSKPEGHFGIRAERGALIGEFEDRFALTAEGWRIRKREARFIMHATE